MSDEKIMSGWTNLPLDSRVENLLRGGESFFTDKDAESVILTLVCTPGIEHITAITKCPHTGFTRLSVRNFRLTDEKFITTL